MKKIVYFLCAASCALLFAACNKIEKVSEESQEPEVKQTATLKAAIEETKTSMGANGVSMLWSAGDQLAVLSDDDWTITNYTLTTGAGNNEAVFGGEAKTGTQFLAIYPSCNVSKEDTFYKVTIPITQTYVENGIASNLLPMYARGSDLEDMTFSYAGGVIRIKLFSPTSKTISSINLEYGSIYDDTSFDYYFSKTGQQTAYGGHAGDNNMTLDCGEGVTLGTTSGTATEFHFVYGGSFTANGFSILVSATDGSKMRLAKSGSFTFSLGKVISFATTEFVDNVTSDYKKVSLDGGSYQTLATVAADASLKPTTSVTLQTLNDAVLTSADIEMALTIVGRTESTAVSLDLHNCNYESTTFRTIQNQTKLGYIDLPINVTTLLASAFQSSKLTGINLRNVQTINTYAFDYTKIATLNIPASVNNIPANAWLAFRCDTMTEFVVDSGNSTFESIDGVLFTKAGKKLKEYPKNKPGSSYTIPEGVNEIGVYSMRSSKYLTSLTFPSTMSKDVPSGSITSNVTTLTCVQTSPAFVFANNGSDFGNGGTLTVPTGCGDNYINAWPWLSSKGWTVNDGSGE